MLSDELHGADKRVAVMRQSTMRTSSPALWVVALGGALLLASAGGWALGWQGLWAFRFLIFVPWPLRLVMAFGILLLVNARLQEAITRILYPVARLPVARFPAAWLGVPLAGLCFWVLRESTWRGDALLKVHLLTDETLQSDPYVWKEPLDSLVAYTVTGLVRPLGLQPEHAVGALSVLAGMVYVAAVLYGARILATSHGGRSRYVIGLLALGTTQLWFGHVENYSLVTACTLVVVVLALGYVQGANRLWPVGLLAGLAVSLHPQALFSLPALLWLISRRHWRREILTLAVTGAVGPLVMCQLMALLDVPWPNLAGGFAGDSQLFLTPAQAFAPDQLWDVINNLWLVAPLAPLWLVIGGWAVRQTRLRHDPNFRYLSGLAAGLLVYLIFFQNDLPRPRDWDLFAIVGPGVTLWGLYAWETWLASPGVTGPPRRAIAWPALLFATLFTLAWVGVNHSFTLIQPHSDERLVYTRYRLVDLLTRLPQAQVTPPEPICTAQEPSGPGCERVAATEFTMPQNGDTRPVLFAHAPARIVLPLPLPAERTFLWLSPALDPESWGWGGDGVTFQVAVEQDGVETILWTHHYTPADMAASGWQQVFVSLAPYRGQTVNLVLSTLPGPANDNAADRAGWGLPWLMRGTPAE